jgi:hypothetical protein
LKLLRDPIHFRSLVPGVVRSFKGDLATVLNFFENFCAYPTGNLLSANYRKDTCCIVFNKVDLEEGIGGRSCQKNCVEDKEERKKQAANRTVQLLVKSIDALDAEAAFRLAIENKGAESFLTPDIRQIFNV